MLDHPSIKARLGATFVPTPKQVEAEALLDGPATHVLGGSRSGKTALICRKIVQRALRAPKSRHLIARFRFNHVIQSIWHDTLPAAPVAPPGRSPAGLLGYRGSASRGSWSPAPSARERLRFWEGKWGDIGESALWSFALIETDRVAKRPDLQRIVVAVDPSGTKGDDGGDTVGIVVVGLGNDGDIYVVEDASVKAAPRVWGALW